MMDILPAIDLKGGQCVRLAQGREEASQVYSSDPLSVARGWERQGGRRIHLVNLDGAFGRASTNLDVLRQIANEVPVHIQYGGGLRSLADMQEALDAGAWRIVLGTVAIEDPPLLGAALKRFGADRVIVALDILGGKVATKGWKTISAASLRECANRLAAAGVQEVLVTDIERDGMLAGPNLPLLLEAASAELRVIASGGISSGEDIRAILDLGEPEICGVIVGKALYEGRVTLRELLEIVDHFSGRK
jgi:phosphoribosylformimino-5-aminoimidazole carboxamide ribotide isomerase